MTRLNILITNAWRARHPEASKDSRKDEAKIQIDIETLELLSSQLADAGALRSGLDHGLVRNEDLCGICPHWIWPEDVAGTLEVLRTRPGVVTAVDQAELEEVLAQAALHGGGLIGPIVMPR